MVRGLTANEGDASDLGSMPGLGRSLGQGNDTPLQYPCLGNPMDEGPGGPQSVGLQRRTRQSDSTHSISRRDYFLSPPMCQGMWWGLRGPGLK